MIKKLYETVFVCVNVSDVCVCVFVCVCVCECVRCVCVCLYVYVCVCESDVCVCVCVCMFGALLVVKTITNQPTNHLWSTCISPCKPLYTEGSIYVDRYIRAVLLPEHGFWKRYTLLRVNRYLLCVICYFLCAIDTYTKTSDYIRIITGESTHP